MTNRETITLVLGDIINVFKCIAGTTGKVETIFAINTQWCGMIATIAGYILKHKYEIEGLTIRSHPTHIFIGYGDVNYDTIFPHGYTEDITELWRLKQNGFCTEICEDEVGKEVNKGWWDWEFLALAEAMYTRHGINPPESHWGFIKGTEELTTTTEASARKVLMRSRREFAINLPKTQLAEIENCPEFFQRLRDETLFE